jgi:hypothetical protein
VDRFQPVTTGNVGDAIEEVSGLVLLAQGLLAMLANEGYGCSLPASPNVTPSKPLQEKKVVEQSPTSVVDYV